MLKFLKTVSRKYFVISTLAISGILVVFTFSSVKQLAWRVTSEIEFKILNYASTLMQSHENNSFGSRNYLSSHRGVFSDTVIENSEKSIIMASQKGFRYIEIDVSFSKDFVPFIFHDVNLKQKTGLDSDTNNVFWKEIQKLKLSDNQKIISLQYFLSKFALLFDGVILDIKSDNKNFKEKAISLDKVIRESNFGDNIFVIGLPCLVLDTIKEMNSKLKVGCENQGFLYNYFKGNDLMSLNYYTQFSVFEYSLINKFDMTLILWTVNNIEDLGKLRSLNNTIVLTDLSNVN